MGRTWQGTADLLAVELDQEERPPTRLPEGVADGDWVTARLYGWEGRVADGADLALLPATRTVSGVLTVMFVETLGTWRLSVNGQSVDPKSVRKAPRPPGPDPLGA